VHGKEALILPCLGRTEIDTQESGPQGHKQSTKPQRHRGGALILCPRASPQVAEAVPTNPTPVSNQQPYNLLQNPGDISPKERVVFRPVDKLSFAVARRNEQVPCKCDVPARCQASPVDNWPMISQLSPLPRDAFARLRPETDSQIGMP